MIFAVTVLLMYENTDVNLTCYFFFYLHYITIYNEMAKMGFHKNLTSE